MMNPGWTWIGCAGLLALLTAFGDRSRDQPLNSPRVGTPTRRDGGTFATGAKVGEVGPDRAVLWARRTAKGDTAPAAPEAGQLQAMWWPVSREGVRTSSAWVDAKLEDDAIHQFGLRDLEPGTRYAFEVRTRASSEDQIDVVHGSFSTAPVPSDRRGVSFVVVTGQDIDRRDEGELGHRIYRSMGVLQPDFFVHTGDVVYYDKGDPRAKDVEGARLKWAEMYSLPLQRAFHLQVPCYFLKDDHDTLKDDCWPGQTYGELTFDQGVAVFREQVPSAPKPYRHVRWGRHLEVWFLEGREFRSPNKLPDGPGKTILGAEQFAWLERTLAESNATHRVVISATPIVGPDRSSKADNHSNRAFRHEGERLRTLLGRTPGVVVLCGDRHWQYVSRDPVSGLLEFSCGPTTDRHAGGFSEDQRTEAHRYLAVRGGFLSATVGADRGPGEGTPGAEASPGEGPDLILRHHDTHGIVVHEEVLAAE